MRISDWSSDVCSSDLLKGRPRALRRAVEKGRGERGHAAQRERQVPRQLGQRDAGVAADRLRRTSGGAEPAVEFDHMEQVRQLAHLIALPRMLADRKSVE